MVLDLEAVHLVLPSFLAAVLLAAAYADHFDCDCDSVLDLAVPADILHALEDDFPSLDVVHVAFRLAAHLDTLVDVVAVRLEDTV